MLFISGNDLFLPERLLKDGRNFAIYSLEIREVDKNVFTSGNENYFTRKATNRTEGFCIYWLKTLD